MGTYSYSIQNVVIEGNYVHDMESQVYFGSNVCYTSGTVVKDIIFRNNIFSRVAFMGQTWGNDPMTNISFFNNVFYKVGYKYYLYGTTRSYATHAISASAGVTESESKNNVFLECGDEPALTSKGWYGFGSGYTLSSSSLTLAAACALIAGWPVSDIRKRSMISAGSDVFAHAVGRSHPQKAEV